MKKNGLRLLCAKRFFVIHFLFLLLLLLPVMSFAGDAYGSCRSGDFRYRVLDDGTVELTDFYSEAEHADIVLPQMVGSKVVSTLSGDFYFHAAASVTIPNGIVSIKGNPFFDDVFRNDWIGEFRVYPDHPTLEVKNGCLIDKREKKIIAVSVQFTDIPDGVEILGRNCGVNLVYLDIPDHVTTIEHGAFAPVDCPDSLRKVTIPNTVTKLIGNPFSNTHNFAGVRVILEKDHPTLEIVNGALYDKTDHRLIYMLERKSNFTVRPGTEKIEDQAFYCGPGSRVSSVTLPDSIKSLGKYAFWETNLAKINLPEGLETIGDGCFYQCRQLKSISIPESVKKIGSWIFDACVNLEKVNIPDSVTEIGNSAFSSCEKLKSITIPESVKKIGIYAFSWCDNLGKANVPENVTEIGMGAFMNCPKLKEITIGKGLTEIDSSDFVAGVFDGCNNVESLTLTGSISQWRLREETRAKVKTVTLGEGTTEVEKDAFAMFNKLEKVILPDSVTHIGESAFRGCEKLKYISLPGGLKEMAGQATFQNCVSLESITIPGSVQCIGENAFEGCKKLKNVVIENGVKEIRNNAFQNCPNLKTITIPQSVEKIITAFDPQTIKMIVERDSNAEQYCIENSIRYSYADEV